MRPLLKYLVAWGGLLSILFFALAGLWKNDFQNIDQSRFSLERRLALLERLEGLPEREEEITQRLEDLGVHVSEEFLYASELSVARSSLQRDVRDLAAKANVRLRMIRLVTASRQSGPLLQMAVNMQMEVRLEDYLAFVNAVETHTPMLRFKRTSIQSRRGDALEGPTLLNVSAEIVGYKIREVVEE